MSYNNSNYNPNKPWAPQPIKKNDTSNRNNSNKKKQFFNDMKRTAENNKYRGPYYLNPNKDLFKKTENGCIQYSTTGKKLLDIHYQMSSLRDKSEKEITSMFQEAFLENPSLAIRWLFYATDIRGGCGERRLFQVIVKDMINNGGEDIVVNIVPLIPEYSRWDMLYTLLEVTNGKVYNAVKDLISSQWSKDLANMSNNEPISLMAKWLKSVNSHSTDTRKKGLLTAKMLGLTERQYRKYLSALRDYLKVVETRMSSNNWQAIDYEQVPSKANLIYSNAFLRHDTERRLAYIEALEEGKVKINSKVAYPYEILNKCVRANSKQDVATYEEMWKALPNLLANDYSDTLVVADSSDSMEWATIPGTKITAKTVAYSIALYMAERNKGAFQNRVITFSSKPKVITFPYNCSLSRKYNILRINEENSNTNIEAVFDLILQTAVTNGYGQEDLPSRVLIITDGEFDYMTDDKHSYDLVLKDKFEKHGYIMPKLIFWNVANRSGTYPFHESNKFPCTLVSGFSVNVFKMVLSDKINPWDALLDQLLVERYDAAEKCLKYNASKRDNFKRDNFRKNVSKKVAFERVSPKKVAFEKVAPRKKNPKKSTPKMDTFQMDTFQKYTFGERSSSNYSPQKKSLKVTKTNY